MVGWIEQQIETRHEKHRRRHLVRGWGQMQVQV